MRISKPPTGNFRAGQMRISTIRRLSRSRFSLPRPAAPWTKQLDYLDISTRLQLLGVTFDREKYSAGDTVTMTVRLKGEVPGLPTAVMLYPSTAAGLELPAQESR